MEKSCCAAKPDEAITSSLTLYTPLIIILGVSLAMSFALHYGTGLPVMNILMAFFLGFIAILKLFNLTSFAESFARYDILAKRSSLYARTYPFIELGIALSFFAGTLPMATNIALLAITLIGNIGVWNIVRSGTSVQCACVGTGFNFPVGRVTLIENAAMSLMAAINIYALATYSVF